MPTDFYYASNGQRVELERSADTLAVAYVNPPDKDREALIREDGSLVGFTAGRDILARNLVVYKRSPSAVATLEEFAARVAQSPLVRYVLPIYLHGKTPIVITDEFAAAFKTDVTPAQIAAMNGEHQVAIVEKLKPANTYLLKVLNPDRGCLSAAVAYFESGRTRYAEPNRITIPDRALRPNDVFFSRQWHLPRIQAPEAWDLTRGSDGIIVAVFDDAVDVGHEEFARAGKVVSAKDFLSGDDDPSPGPGESHGTAVSGVAVADGNNGIGVSGAAPGCKLMPVRLIGAAITDQRIADAFRHATDHDAAVINNSWAQTPNSGAFPLPGIVSDEFDHAVTHGRSGKGSVILFAAGNGNESISAAASRNDYACDARVIAVAAVNDQNVRSGYSDFGEDVDVCAPSNGSRSAGIVGQANHFSPDDGSTLNIFTTDVTGPAGYNPPPPIPAPPEGMALESSPDVNYTSTFGGTSSACPLTAGVVALMLSANHDLTRDQVQFVLEATADKVDATNTDPVGQYLPNGHSHWYGYGRVNAFEAVKGARSLVGEHDFAQQVFVTLRRTAGDEFVSDGLTTVDARTRPADGSGAIRGSQWGLLRVEMPGRFDEVEVDA